MPKLKKFENMMKGMGGLGSPPMMNPAVRTESTEKEVPKRKKFGEALKGFSRGMRGQ